MKPLNSPRSRTTFGLTLAVFGSLLQISPADTLTLKDGTKLEGKAVEVTADSVKFEYRPTPSIKEEKVFKKTDIAELKTTAPDEAAIVEIRKLLPTPDLMSPTEYSKAIEGQLKPFLSKFPTSKLADEVKKTLATYEEELGKLNNGWQKIDGQWISPDENRWNYYVIEARVLRKEMENEIKKNNVKGALDKMARLKKDYGGTKSFVDALDLYSKLLDDYDRELTRMQLEQPALLKELNERKKTLDKAALDDLEVALKKDSTDLKIKVQAETAAKVPIISVDKLDLASLKAGQSAVTKERVAVQKMLNEKTKYVEVADLVEKGLAEGGKGNAQMAFTLIEQAQKKLGANDAGLKAMRDKWKLASDEMAKLAPKPTPAANTDTPVKGDPAAPAKSGDGAGKKPAATKAETKPKPAASAPAPLEEESDNSMYLLAGAGVLVLGALGWMFGKRKKKADDDE